MKKLISKSKISILITLSLSLISCNSQTKTNSTKQDATNFNEVTKIKNLQIADYLTGIYEDEKGAFWFSTLTKGIAKYDRVRLTYDTTIGSRVGSITQDSDNNLWFGTHNGVYKYDGHTFTNYSVDDGLCDNLVSNIMIDTKGTIWVGTWGGVCKFDGERFVSFPIPNPNIKLLDYQTTMNWSTEIMEDSKGNIWFARDGYGATKYDGETFTHFTKKDGLASNSVCDIQEDKQGNIWFSSRVTERDNPDADKRFGAGGLVKYDGKNFITFPELPGLSKSDVYQIYRDTKDNIWIGTLKNGVYKYNGTDFTNFNGKEGNFAKPVIVIFEDSKGTIWLGCAGGLYRITPDGDIVNIKVNGPWKQN